MNMAKILIIDDEVQLSKVLKSVISQLGHEVTCVPTVHDGLETAASGCYDVVFLDVRFPDGNGLDILNEIRLSPSRPEVIIMTGVGDPDGAEFAIKNGAWDYLEKPVLIDNIQSQLINALQYREEKKFVRTSKVLKRDGIVGDSPQMINCLKLVEQAASSDINVLITGETGTGKECFASAIHENSSRTAGNFVIVDCAALPDTLVESTLFGHVKGAFTGADRDMDGLIKQADGGTLFLDEVGELPMSVQKAFLRVLQEHTYRPVGGKTELESDFRLVAATNRNLSRMVEEGTFREDLLYRIKSLAILLPPLRERKQDIKELVMHIILKICDRDETAIKGFSNGFINLLEAYNWPGNVREVINVLEWALSKARYEQTLFPKHLPEHIRIDVARSSLCPSLPKPEATITASEKIRHQFLPKLKEFREAIIVENERKYLRDLIAFTNGNIRQACSISGVGRARLYGLMRNYGIAKSY
jgi:two-component system, NtrC family, response regulator